MNVKIICVISFTSNDKHREWFSKIGLNEIGVLKTNTIHKSCMGAEMWSVWQKTREVKQYEINVSSKFQK